MTLKKILILIFFSIFITACSVTDINYEKIITKKDKSLIRPKISAELLSDINHILFLLKRNDLKTLNNTFIHPRFNYYELIKDENLKEIVIERKTEINELNNDIESFEKKQEVVTFNCSPYDDAYYGWDKEGVFLNYSENINISEMMKKENIIKLNTFSEEEIKRAIFIEKNSYEVIVPYNIIFHLTLIDKQWYITLIDKIKTDCSDIVEK